MLFLDYFFGFGAITLGFLYLYIGISELFIEYWN